MNLKNLVWFCVSAIVTFIIMGLFKGNFEWIDWDNFIPVVGGLIGITIASYKDKILNQS